MSVDYMTLAWRTELQAGPRLVLLAICDNANDDGNCYPSIQALANKSGLSVRAVRGHVASMTESGLLLRNERAGRSTFYQIALKALRAAVFKSLSARKELSDYDKGVLRSCAPDESDLSAKQIATPADSAPRQILPTPPADSASHPSPFLPTPPADSAAITNKEPTVNQQGKKTSAKAPVAGKPAAPAFVLPDWIPADTWAAFMETRKAKKARSTDYALGLIVKSLDGFKAAGHDPIEVLNNSIKAGWSDVYAPKAAASAMTPSRRTPAPENFAARTYTGGRL